MKHDKNVIKKLIKSAQAKVELAEQANEDDYEAHSEGYHWRWVTAWLDARTEQTMSGSNTIDSLIKESSSALAKAKQGLEEDDGWTVQEDVEVFEKLTKWLKSRRKDG